jgi:hypothetical protein
MRSLGLRCALALAAAGGCGEEKKPGSGEPGGAPAAGAEVGAGGATKVSDTDRPAPAPPSTGNEMEKPAEVRLTPEQAKEALARIDEELKKPGEPNEAACNQMVQVLLLAIPVAAPKVDEKTFPYYKALQRCARKTRRWNTVVRATAAMLPLGAEKAQPEELVRALVEIGEFDKAEQALAELGSKLPDGKAGLLAARSFLVCKKEDWAKCLATIDQGMAEIKKTDPKLVSEPALKNRVFRGIALMFLGKLDEAEADWAALESAAAAAPKATPEKVAGLKAILDQVRKKAAEGRATGLIWDTVVQPKIALGVYHLYGYERTGAPVEIRFYNLGDKPRMLRVEAQIPGVTEAAIRSVTLLSGAQREVVYLVPQLSTGFAPAAVRSDKPVQLHLKINDGDRVLYEDTLAVALLPRDSLPLFREIGADITKMTPEYIGAWITPNSRAVDSFLTAAKQRHPQKMFVGEQAGTVPQVKAIYDELKARGVTYVMDPTVNTDLVKVQRTRLPSEVLESTNAQCLEGTILFATLLESIGLRPIIVLVPGHAYVGWHGTRADGVKPDADRLFLETTMVGNATFEQAVKTAMARTSTELKSGNVARGTSQLIELTALRQGGIKPQPME